MRNRILAVLATVLVLAGSARAGQTCGPVAPRPAEVRAGLQLALKVQTHLDDQGARVAVIGRVGRDLSEYGLRYSHVGLAVRDDTNGRWNVVHLLNHCGRADSDLYDQGLGNFFLDGLYRYEAVVLVPSVALQERLAAAVGSGTARALHQPAYSVIAHPWSGKYQNSNQWLLEVAAASIDEGEQSRKAAQARLARDGYQPSILTLPPAKRLGARLFSVSTRFDDHGMDEWSSSRYQVVSAESVLDWLARVDRPVRKSVLALP